MRPTNTDAKHPAKKQSDGSTVEIPMVTFLGCELTLYPSVTAGLTWLTLTYCTHPIPDGFSCQLAVSWPHGVTSQAAASGKTSSWTSSRMMLLCARNSNNISEEFGKSPEMANQSCLFPENSSSMQNYLVKLGSQWNTDVVCGAALSGE